MKERKPPRAALIGGLIVVSALATTLLALQMPWGQQLWAIFADPQRLAETVRDAGPWAPLAFIGLYIAQAIAAPIPGQALNFAAGYLFGFIPGLLYSWGGLILGATLALLLGRYAGRPLLRRLVNPAALERMDRLAAGRGLGFFFLVFLIPGLPDDLACFVAGLTPLSLWKLIAVSALARLPSLVASVWLGVYAQQLPWQGWAILGVLTLAGVFVAWRCGGRIQDTISRWLAQHA